MSVTSSWNFPPFHLDCASSSLWREGQLVALPPKPFAVLAYLVSHAGEVVTKADLLDAVWPDTAVTEGVLKGCIRQLRQVLGDTATEPRYIVTVHRRGYRFVAPVMSETPPDVVPETLSPAHLPVSVLMQQQWPDTRGTGLIVGREGELADLNRVWQQVCQGERQVVFITGEAGIGKTTLVDTFIAQLKDREAFWLGHGQCIEHYGAGEAYLPLLEALGQVGRGPEHAPLLEVLRQQAPNWLLQLPALVSDDEIDRLHRRASGTTPERMLRELTEAVETLTVKRPLVLVLEDLHWSDGATLDWLRYMARRRLAARLLVLGTYRPTDAIIHGHPVHTVTQDLQLHGQARELVLAYLPETAVASYLAQRFGKQLLPERFVRTLHRQTDGNPMFLVAVVDALVRQEMLTQGATGWEFVGQPEARVMDIPENLRQFIDQQLVQLPAADQELLEVASVAGAEFIAAAVAAGLEDTEEAVDARCDALARQGQFLRTHGPTDWPDGTMSARYGFLHDLYREVLYERVPASRRVRWHRQIGRRLEAGYGARARELAAELAEHFMRGRDPERAVQYLRDAGENAQQRSAHQEAIGHLTRGLELLDAFPEVPERAQKELTLLLALGPALNITRGDASPEVEQTYVRAQALCQQQGESSQSLRVMRGLWSVYHGRLQFRQARDLGEEYLALAHREDDPVALMEAYYVLGTSLFYLGEFPTARERFEQGVAYYNLQRERFWGSRAEDPGVACLAFLVSTLGFLGYPDQAQQRADEARHLAQELSHPYSLAFAQYRAGLNALFYREAPTAQALAEAVLGIATTHGFPFYEALGMALKGGALVRQGQADVGLALLRQGLNGLYQTGTQPAPHWLVWQAELCGYVGQLAEGLKLLEEARVQADTTGNFHAVAELYRLKGEFLLTLSGEQLDEVEACFSQALAVSRSQQAKTLELRAAVSLSRLWQRQGKRDPARHLLAEVYNWFAEGFDTADLKEAKSLLEKLQV
jgi:DNA-binding winged helix-turn-helix (wHTH) protein/predicted ATPase